MFLTLLTPTYNRAHKLHRVYESIKSQTLQKVDGEYIFEWIVIDDGSDDGTDELVKKWKKEVDWPIVYKYQENRGKWKALQEGIKIARGELTLIADSDDEFLPETFETFYNIWNKFTDEEKAKCGGIGVLCQDQHGNRVGCDYPVEKQLIPSLEAVFGWQNIGLGETWAALKTQNLKNVFQVPDKAKDLKFIPESFFWSRIVFELRPYSYFLNKVLRIYYRNEGDGISRGIREKYADGFLFESKWFVTKYWNIAWRYPKIFFKHLIKLVYFSWKVGDGAR